MPGKGSWIGICYKTFWNEVFQQQFCGQWSPFTQEHRSTAGNLKQIRHKSVAGLTDRCILWSSMVEKKIIFEQNFVVFSIFVAKKI